VAVRRALSFLATVTVVLLVAILPSTPAAAEPAGPGPPDPRAPTVFSELAAVPAAGSAYDQDATSGRKAAASAVFWQAWSAPASYRPSFDLVPGAGWMAIAVRTCRGGAARYGYLQVVWTRDARTAYTAFRFPADGRWHVVPTTLIMRGGVAVYLRWYGLDADGAAASAPCQAVAGILT
jgi:hypothetical protein